VKSDLAATSTQYNIDVDPNKAILDGTSTAQVQSEVYAALVGTKAGTVALAGVATDVYVQIDANLTGTDIAGGAERLAQLPVGVAKMPLGSIATVKPVDNQSRISRVDQSPAATISADTTSKDTGGVSSEIQKVVNKLQADGSWLA